MNSATGDSISCFYDKLITPSMKTCTISSGFLINADDTTVSPTKDKKDACNPNLHRYNEGIQKISKSRLIYSFVSWCCVSVERLFMAHFCCGPFVYFGLFAFCFGSYLTGFGCMIV